MTHGSGITKSPCRRFRRLLAVTMLAGAALGATAYAASTPAGAAAKPTSSCVACHTDVARIQEEAKGIPVPTASALQAGKG